MSGVGPSAALGLSGAAVWSAALGLCVGQLASAPSEYPPEVSGGRPAGVSVVGPQSANLGVRTLASGVCWGWLSPLHLAGAEGGGPPEA